eukprot:353090-Chlamydomonas_euryale.AAC.11
MDICRDAAHGGATTRATAVQYCHRRLRNNPATLARTRSRAGRVRRDGLPVGAAPAGAHLQWIIVSVSLRQGRCRSGGGGGGGAAAAATVSTDLCGCSMGVAVPAGSRGPPLTPSQWTASAMRRHRCMPNLVQGQRRRLAPLRAPRAWLRPDRSPPVGGNPWMQSGVEIGLKDDLSSESRPSPVAFSRADTFQPTDASALFPPVRRAEATALWKRVPLVARKVCGYVCVHVLCGRHHPV